MDPKHQIAQAYFISLSFDLVVSNLPIIVFFFFLDKISVDNFNVG